MGAAVSGRRKNGEALSPKQSQDLGNLQRSASSISWRNKRSSWPATCIFMMTVPPALVILTWIALEHFDGSILNAVYAIKAQGFTSFIRLYAPAPSLQANVLYATWILFQAFLYTILPGRSNGQMTPAGHLLEYRTNGLLAYEISIGLFLLCVFSGFLDPTIIARHWEGLIIAYNIWGYALSCIAYIKAHYAPSHADDRHFSGSALYDFLMGIEFNPRFGQTWDWKLFHNERPGIIAWTLINLSYAAVQYKKFGVVTNSMIIVNIFHLMYVVDLFINEAWYVKTIDIAHDHFGFYLAWGSAVWLPTMYTLQTQYLARNPVQLHPAVAAAILLMGIGGYALFRSVNNQKYLVRRTNGDCKIWGKPAKYMRASYITGDGKTHESILLMSGWWGVSRHFNYVGDLMLSYAMCAVCGTRDIIPWTYAFFMTAILVHRCLRDEKRLETKYGEQWTKYCAQVRWRLIPGIW
ncbi:7-dehydrosterol-delta 7-reductase [Phyllosticta capitalensis]